MAEHWQWLVTNWQDALFYAVIAILLGWFILCGIVLCVLSAIEGPSNYEGPDG